MTTYDVRDDSVVGVVQTVAALQRGDLVVLPTDTVYGVAADAFSPAAVERLLAAKGRGRDMPVPVLIGTMRTLDGIAARVTDTARELVEAFWPGGLTIVCHQQPSLAWDLGDAAQTVAVRMPLHPVALDLLKVTGPMAVSSANRTGLQAARDADEAERMLGERVRVILDAGPTPGPIASTIVDCTTDEGRVLRRGVITLEQLNEVVAAHDAVIQDES